MGPEWDGNGGDAPSAEEAFAALGNDTRMDILRILGEADEPLSFSELLDRVDLRDSGQFNYHLDKVLGHFVRKTDDGYRLHQPGRRVIEAVRTGAVTDAPVVAPTPTEHSCFVCGDTMHVSYRDERMAVYCPGCPGLYGPIRPAGQDDDPDEYGLLALCRVPPSRVRDTTPTELLDVGVAWYVSEMITMASGLCPRCAAAVEDWMDVCEEHERTGGLCDRCDRYYAVQYQSRCTNCLYDLEGIVGIYLLRNLAFRDFLTDHGYDPVSPGPSRISSVVAMYDEDVIQADPFEARYTFTADGDELTLTVSDDLTVSRVVRA